MNANNTGQKNAHVVWQVMSITRDERERLQGHRSFMVWFTGLSGSGKSTMIYAVEEQLYRLGYRTFALDGDHVRRGLCADLGFSHSDRSENIRRVGEAAKLLTQAGVIVLAAFISPFKADRQKVRNLMAAGDFIEVFCDCPLAVCEARDVKGLYKKAREGEIRDFTGISSPYEKPDHPDLVLETAKKSVEECTGMVMAKIKSRLQFADLGKADLAEL
ncbi:MAG: adenylyl-sulfate kinase [Magnetococcales bacterium]|nr:adenylyl-sulfate kinase [Magnetococcales bacterium]MBF0149212.1 adenylyl-sulfate kinase [Magnetococcales bacterium]MBF0171978.1 adenylyl-sulfate kinase [Magnetococcales bacterium]MBF0349123.1 adenylyl-sulfate kinase [Magnetococcales bacterium]MBF0630560.1 adenylyl-sulfate kinase [Magnetococcales bacterium]